MSQNCHFNRFFLITLLSLLPVPGVAQSELESTSAEELIARMDSLLWSTTSQGRFRMSIETQYWQRELELDVWMHRPDKTFIRVLSPRKERGIGSLRLGDEMWNYIPNIDRVVKIPPSMMLQPWMGSDLSNDDLVKQSSLVRDYEHVVAEDSAAGGGEILHIISTPNEDAAVVWGRIESWIQVDSGIPTRQVYYDDIGGRVREIEFSDVSEMDGRTLPTRWTLRPTDEPDKRTVFLIDQIEFDREIEPGIFTQRNLRSQNF